MGFMGEFLTGSTWPADHRLRHVQQTCAQLPAHSAKFAPTVLKETLHRDRNTAARKP